MIDDIVLLGQLVLQLGRVDRATHHPDGIRAETDTDHTVMLGMIACAFAERSECLLDLGKIAQFSLVHDFVESLVGDTNSFAITPEDLRAKEDRERLALNQIREQFADSLPWIVYTIDQYEMQDTAEARFVKCLDKAMPKICHILNEGASFRIMGKTREDVAMTHDAQWVKLNNRFGNEFPGTLRLMRELMELSLQSGFPGIMDRASPSGVW